MNRRGFLTRIGIFGASVGAVGTVTRALAPTEKPEGPWYWTIGAPQCRECGHIQQTRVEFPKKPDSQFLSGGGGWVSIGAPGVKNEVFVIETHAPACSRSKRNGEKAPYRQ